MATLPDLSTHDMLENDTLTGHTDMIIAGWESWCGEGAVLAGEVGEGRRL